MDEMEFYNKHYIITREDTAILDGWSDGPHDKRPIEGANLFNAKGTYQFRLFPDGEDNPPLADEWGVPLYKYNGKKAVKRSQKEIEDERPEPPEPGLDVFAFVNGIAEGFYGQ